MVESPPLTDLIRRAQDGDEHAFRQMFDATYQDLRRLARQRLARGGRGTLLDTTALVHESFMRFANAGNLQLQDRQHFMRYTSHVMRSVIVDLARAGKAERRGGEVAHVTLNTAIGDVLPDGEEEILRVHEAVEELSALDHRIVQALLRRRDRERDRGCTRRHRAHGAAGLRKGAAAAGARVARLSGRLRNQGAGNGTNTSA